MWIHGTLPLIHSIPLLKPRSFLSNYSFSSWNDDVLASEITYHADDPRSLKQTLNQTLNHVLSHQNTILKSLNQLSSSPWQQSQHNTNPSSLPSSPSTSQH